MAHEPIACPHYVALNGSRRCVSYVDGGGCQREDTFMCTEWLRKNSSARALKPATPAASTPQATQAATATDLFGQLVRAQPSNTRTDSKPSRSLPSPSSAQPPSSFTRPITEEEIKALEERGVELCVRAETVSELWLVPAYTGSARNEMTFRDAATIAAVCAAFPGAEVTTFKQSQKKGALK